MSEQSSTNEQETKSSADAAASGASSDPLEEAKAEVAKWKNEYLYLRADFDNYKKAAIKERSDYLKYGSERVFVELLEVVDNFERALSMDVNKDNYESLVKGVQLIHDELKSVLQRFGVTELPSKGEKFDPHIHNALSTEVTAQVPAGHISQVFKKPYKLHDRVIRPGQVVIATEPPESK